MEIFGKRLFVLKTSEMNKKIEAISREEDNSIVNNVKKWLGNVSILADKLKEFQDTASKLRKISHKKNLDHIIAKESEKLSILGITIKKQEDGKYNGKYKIAFVNVLSSINTDDFQILKAKYSSELKKFFYSSSGKISVTLPYSAKDLEDWLKREEKEYREAKQKFKDIFEEVYKALKSYIKKLEKVNKASKKGTGQEDIKQVAKSEIAVFEKYGIPLVDKGCSKLEKCDRKGDDAFEKAKIEITEDDNLLVEKVKDWLEKVKNRAETYQNAHEAANNIIRYTQSEQSDLVNKELKKLHDIAKEVKSTKPIDCVLYCHDFKGLGNSNEFPEAYEVKEADMTAIKQGCEEAQKALLEAFEEVYKALELYIEKLEKVNKANEKIEKEEDKKNIGDVAEFEIAVFGKYGISD